MGDNIILELRHIEKSFPGVKALKDISLMVRRGTVHALVGENGAGKSTMMKILTGILPKDAGEILIDGKEVQIASPLHAQSLGLSIIFQEFNLVNSLSIAENLFVGRLKKRGVRGVDWTGIYRDAEGLLGRIGLKIDPRTKVAALSVAAKQMVEIAKALSYNPKILVMDEPSATLTNKELDNLYQIVEQLRRDGVTVIYISHRLEEVFRLSDWITVIRDGEVIETRKASDISREQVIQLMVGRSMDQEYPARSGRPQNEVVLKAEGLCRKGVFEDVSFELHKGERLGIAGLVGAGRTEIVRAIFGADRLTSGVLSVRGKPVRFRSPCDAIQHGIGLLTEDRKGQGLVLDCSIGWNTTLCALKKVMRGGFVKRGAEARITDDYIKTLRIKAPGGKTTALNLSGGNQQKVVIAKWLFTDAEVLILDEPTRGIDVGAKYEIYQIINQLADSGKAVILISSEMPEVLNMSDRLLVVHAGRVKGELTGAEMTGENVMKMAILEGGRA
jgi:ABC-type sugar transport system ATPase subunit